MRSCLVRCGWKREDGEAIVLLLQCVLRAVQGSSGLSAAIRLYWCHYILPLGLDRKATEIFILVAAFSIIRNLVQPFRSALRLSLCSSPLRPRFSLMLLPSPRRRLQALRCMSPLYLTLEDPSASEDFDFEIRVVPSVVSLPVDSCLVSLANNRQVRFFPCLFFQCWPFNCVCLVDGLWFVQVREMCRIGVCAIHVLGGFGETSSIPPSTSPHWSFHWRFGQFLKLSCWSNRARRKLEDRPFSAVSPFRSEQIEARCQLVIKVEVTED